MDNLKYNVDNHPLTISNKTFLPEYKQKMKLQATMLNFYYDFSLKSKVKPYVGIGAGYANIKPGEASRVFKQSKSLWTAKEANNFTYALMTGISVNMTDMLNLDLGYRFQNFGKANGLDMTKSKNIKWTSVKDLQNFKIKTHSIMVGVRYNFSL